MMKDSIHRAIVEKYQDVCAWFLPKGADLYIPFYSSYDIRDSGNKIAAVDANIFPAGFNNICQADRDFSVELAQKYIFDHYGNQVRNILLLCEEHTNNPYYWENVNAIRDILEGSSFRVRIAVPEDRIRESFEVQSVLGTKILVEVARSGQQEVLDGFKADLILSNNDFSRSYSEWTEQLQVPINPSPGLGWHRRKKSNFFKFYNELAGEFAAILGIDPQVFQVRTKLVEDFDVSKEDSRKNLAHVVESMLEELVDDYQKRGISEPPYLYIKNNSGTYGLGVTEVASAEDVLEWNYKEKKKMKATKGGGGVHEVIVQEGISTQVKSGEDTAEPAIYMIGCHLAGGFLRAHQSKDARQSLNSPGAVYRRLCVSDLEINVEGKPLENVYGWVAKLGVLAIGLETQAMGVKYPGYQMKKSPC
jgi:glutamate--cysteine ligase